MTPPKAESPERTIDSLFEIHETPKKETHELVPKSMSKKQKAEIMEDKVQRELVEIINDFKNNVHSIAQVEKLVEEWKNRNDVQMSFKEKQEQLTQMRLKYEQIQTEMKCAMKKPTPFERIKRIFIKTKHEKGEAAAPMLNESTNTVQSQRPISSLSTSSSGSSGRMSTISGCSLGDSGTHSDNEDRKVSKININTENKLRNVKLQY